MKKNNRFLIVGLGNPGEKYKNTRHNAGFWVVDKLIDSLNAKKIRARGKSLVYKSYYNNSQIILSKPLTFMNNSGFSVKRLSAVYRVPIENMIIVYDDMDIPIGKIRIRKKGSGGSHNGMRSIISYIQSYDFPRVRIGIGKPEKGADIVEWVLGVPSNEDVQSINDAVKRAEKAILNVIEYGIEYAMQENSKG